MGTKSVPTAEYSTVKGVVFTLVQSGYNGL